MTTDPFFDRMIAEQSSMVIDMDVMRRLEASVVEDPGYVAPDVEVTTHFVPGPHGDVPVRVYRSGQTSQPEPRPVLLWCHGGAWVAGDLDMHEADSTSREVCARTGGVVVSVDYRLALPGVHYPVPVDDVLAAWSWIVNQCRAWGSSPDRLALGGASAGGNLAAGALLRLRDAGAQLPRSVLLVYPSLHCPLPEFSAEELADIGIPEAFARQFDGALRLSMENYLGASIAEAPPYVIPALADLAGLPATLVVACQRDVLRVSAEHFAHALAGAGVRTQLITVPEAPHGHINYPWLRSAQQTYDDMSRWIASA